MLQRILSIIVVSVLVSFSEGAQDVSQNKTDCANELIEWCNNTPTFSVGIGLATFVNTASADFESSHCTTSSSGTRCFKNLSPWFSCSPEKELTYRGTVLKNKSDDGVDDEICDAARKVSKVSVIGVNLTGGLGKGMKDLKDTMLNFRENMDNFHKSILRGCFPFCGNDDSFSELYGRGKYFVTK